MTRALTTFALILALTGAALAHSGTKDPTVKAWMANMKAIAEDTKLIGGMVKGQTAFDAAAANAALDRIAGSSAEIPALFRVRASDPTSEARAAIWSDWDAFEAEADALTRKASGFEVKTPDDLIPALADIGATCTSCHGSYRE